MTTREKAIQIFSTAVAAVQPARLIPAHLFIREDTLHITGQQIPLSSLQHIYVIGAGKASAAMAKEVEEVLGERITQGIIVTKYGHAVALKKITCKEAAHPVPDENGINATKQTIALIQKAGENDLVICVISGGASALWIDLSPGATLPDLRVTYELLLKSGANIQEVNTVRKHLSGVKGGQLLQYAPKATWITLIISDVPGDDLSVIASGPTVPDATSFQDVAKVLDKYQLTHQLPATIQQHIRNGLKGLVKETVKRASPVVQQAHNTIVGSNSIALKAAAKEAQRLGYIVFNNLGTMSGDAATVGKQLVQKASNYAGPLPACWLCGGETTVTVTGNGKGGRNQQMALSVQQELSLCEKSERKICFLSAGTDGTDGPTDATGAIADMAGIESARQQGLNVNTYLDNNDAYHFFEQTGGLLKTGATQTNVMDLVVLIAE